MYSDFTVDLIVIALIVTSLILIGGVYWLKNRKRFAEETKEYTEKQIEQSVKEESTLLKSLEELNQKYIYTDVKPLYTFTINCSSREEYNRTSLEDGLKIVLNEHFNQFHQIENIIKNNIKLSEEYDSLYKKNRIMHSKVEEKGQQYCDIEERLYKEQKKEYNPDYSFKINIEYKTPRNRNISRKSYVYNRSYLLNLKNDLTKQQIERNRHKAFIEKERKLLTPKLRYQILKRDGFKCTICGATQKDGVKLHVDHIKPVSKGGKTTVENLRTLCDRCNLGKGALYDDVDA